MDFDTAVNLHKERCRKARNLLKMGRLDEALDLLDEAEADWKDYLADQNQKAEAFLGLIDSQRADIEETAWKS